MTGFQIVGYYVEKPQVLENSSPKEYATIKVKTKTNFISSFETKEFEEYDVCLWKGMSKEFIESIPLNSAIGIRGRLKMKDNTVILIAEHIEKLSTMNPKMK